DLAAALPHRLLPLVEERLILEHARDLEPGVVSCLYFHRDDLSPSREQSPELFAHFPDGFFRRGAFSGQCKRFATPSSKAVRRPRFDKYRYLHGVLSCLLVLLL